MGQRKPDGYLLARKNSSNVGLNRSFVVIVSIVQLSRPILCEQSIKLARRSSALLPISRLHDREFLHGLWPSSSHQTRFQADFASGNSLLASHQSAPAMASSTPQKPEYSLNTMDTNVDSDFLLNSMQGLTSNIGKNASVRVRLKP
jgi:hypothetical protein